MRSTTSSTSVRSGRLIGMRRRINLLAVLAAVLSTVLFLVPLGYLTAQYLLADERDELIRVADTLAVSISAELSRGDTPAELPSPDDDVVAGLYDPTGDRIAGSGPSQGGAVVRRALGGSEADVELAGDLVVAVPVTDGARVTGVVRAASDYAVVRVQIAQTWAVMAGLAALAVAITWLLARRQGRRLAAPLEDLAHTATRIGDGDFAVRTSPSGIAEIDAAGAAFNTTAQRIGDLVSRERAFSGYASHQLRTPLTGLRLGLEIALHGPPALQQDALARALSSADRLERTIAELLALARDSSPRGEVLDIGSVVDDLTEERRPAVQMAGRTLNLHLEDDLPTSHVAAAAARQILAVLLDNAIAHGRGDIGVAVRSSVGALAVDVVDEGEYRGDLSAVFSRHDYSDRGHGIGLPLARSLAEAEGGRLSLASSAPTTFTLLLPTTDDPVETAPSAVDDHVPSGNSSR